MICCAATDHPNNLILSPRVQEGPQYIKFYSKHSDKTVKVPIEVYSLSEYFTKSSIDSNFQYKKQHKKNVSHFRKQLASIKRKYPQAITVRETAVGLFYQLSPVQFKTIIQKYGPPLRYRWICWNVLVLTESFNITDENFRKLIRSYQAEV